MHGPTGNRYSTLQVGVHFTLFNLHTGTTRLDLWLGPGPDSTLAVADQCLVYQSTYMQHASFRWIFALHSYLILIL